MRSISAEGFQKPKSVAAGAAPMLQWLKIADLVVDPAYQRPIVGKGRQNVDRIAQTFSWSCFAPVVVSPVEGGKFAIIDGQHRTTSAAILGFDSVPCQIVIAAREEQAEFDGYLHIGNLLAVMQSKARLALKKKPSDRPHS